MTSFLGRFSRLSMGLVCAGFSAIVMALCIFAGTQFKQRAEQELYRETENIANVLMASFDESAANLDAVLVQVSSQLLALDLANIPEAELHRLLRRYALRPNVIGPAFINRDGIFVASARVQSVEKTSVADRSMFRVHADDPGRAKVYISAPMRGLVTNEWTIQFSRALRDQSGEFKGVVLASYRLSQFVELYDKLKLSNHGLATLTGLDGVVRIRTLSGAIGYGSSVPRIAQIYGRTLAGEKSGRFHGRSTGDSVTRIGSFVTSQTTPFYVAVGYDEDYLRSQYVGTYYILGLCWLVLTAAMVVSAGFIRSFEKINQRRQIEIVQSAMAERQKISADMHDSIGSSLATLLAHVTSEDADRADIKRRIGEILMELRLLVDSAEPIGGDLNLVLGNIRHRMGAAIELAGIKLNWNVHELPDIPTLSSRDVLSLKLILMEALSNVLHHSKASTVTMSTRYAAPTSTVTIAVEDDGRGFDADDTANAGRGISNMNRRIRTVSIGAALSIDTRPGIGTRVQIELNAPPQNGARRMMPADSAA